MFYVLAKETLIHKVHCHTLHLSAYTDDVIVFISKESSYRGYCTAQPTLSLTSSQDYPAEHWNRTRPYFVPSSLSRPETIQFSNILSEPFQGMEFLLPLLDRAGKLSALAPRGPTDPWCLSGLCLIFCFFYSF